jgi:hypothetical protein
MKETLAVLTVGNCDLTVSASGEAAWDKILLDKKFPSMGITTFPVQGKLLRTFVRLLLSFVL